VDQPLRQRLGIATYRLAALVCVMVMVLPADLCDLKLGSGQFCSLKLDCVLASRRMRRGAWRGFAGNDWTEEQKARFGLD
jgi:hypothetical protein